MINNTQENEMKQLVFYMVKCATKKKKARKGRQQWEKDSFPSQGKTDCEVAFELKPKGIRQKATQVPGVKMFVIDK